MKHGLTRQRPGELPAEVTRFVGRHAELAELTGLLRTARLVTVTGPGGVGKTRVTLRAASQIQDQFADGVCLAELSGLRDPELLPNTVASCLGLAESGGRSQLDAITEYLRDRQLLLILDTCEHLIDACAMLTDLLLRASADVTVLATSRQPLDVPGEHCHAISPLPVTDPSGAGDAVELFAQLATAVVPGFTVTDQNRADVVQLCSRLDGLPLALELAAVRLRALPLEHLVARLEDRFRLLTGGRRAVLAHHQTLRAATEWSYDLCTPTEQLLWTRLSVFAGSFDLRAAEQVCAGAGLPPEDILATLIGLVDKSVVLRFDDGTNRYRLLDTIREFGAEKLAAGEAATIRDRYIGWYAGMASEFGDHFNDDQLNRFRTLRREHPNLRGAIESALASPGKETQAVRLVTALYGYWHIAGLLREGKYWVTKVLERFPDPSPERAALLIVRCYLVYGGVADGREGIAIAERLGEPLLAARGYVYLHLALAASGQLPEAARAGTAAAERLEALGDDIGLVCLDAQLGQMHAVSGDADAALRVCASGLRRAAGSGELWSTSYMHYTTGLALFQQGKYGASAEAEYRALALKTELGDTMGIAHCLEVLAWTAVRQQRHSRAAWLLGAAGALWQRTGRRVSGNPYLEELHQQAARAARETLGEDRYTNRSDRGAGYALDELIALATGDADELPRSAAERPAGSIAGQASPITSREHEIASLVAQGLSNREIAQQLIISKRTVDAHIEHIYAKLGVSSRVQLATWLASAAGGDPESSAIGS